MTPEQTHGDEGPLDALRDLGHPVHEDDGHPIEAEPFSRLQAAADRLNEMIGRAEAEANRIMRDHVPDVPPLRPRTVNTVLDDLISEIGRQDRKARAGDFGGFHILPAGPNHERISVLVEEVGECARELNEARAGNETDGALYTELVQLGASAVAWAAALVEEGEGYRQKIR